MSAVVTTVVSSGFSSGSHGREAHSPVPRGTWHKSHTGIWVFLLCKFIIKVHIKLRYRTVKMHCMKNPSSRIACLLTSPETLAHNEQSKPPTSLPLLVSLLIHSSPDNCTQKQPDNCFESKQCAACLQVTRYFHQGTVSPAKEQSTLQH